MYAQYAMGNKIGIMQGFTEKGKATYADGDGSSFDSRVRSIGIGLH